MNASQRLYWKCPWCYHTHQPPLRGFKNDTEMVFFDYDGEDHKGSFQTNVLQKISSSSVSMTVRFPTKDSRRRFNNGPCRYFKIKNSRLDGSASTIEHFKDLSVIDSKVIDSKLISSYIKGSTIKNSVADNVYITYGDIINSCVKYSDINQASVYNCEIRKSKIIGWLGTDVIDWVGKKKLVFDQTHVSIYWEGSLDESNIDKLDKHQVIVKPNTIYVRR